ncbi:YbjN domain-containing protein [Actinomarinicola tropica]|uniref:YbjN domain-containing protein n=1 Tax=Actinomarinicola tropica TaxID=2789776 RepID=A0A5Q2RGY0_9ACTN|nr:YbjN domain-containing protein [Actinomarinicola tropica]QGG93781.1 hypothetical protein GH723_00900 [Actinomarinicola tropica]
MADDTAAAHVPDDPYADDPPTTPEELGRIEALVDAWAARELADNPVVAAVERGDESGVRRWFVRVHGEEKDVSTIWLTLRQRTLHYETYVMPAPEENHARFYEHLLRRNIALTGVAFAIGIEDAVFLHGAIPARTVDEVALDRILGVVYATVEQCFRPALRIGYASRFA